MELKHYVVTVDRLDKPCIGMLQKIIEYFVNVWMQQEQENLDEKERKDAWFEHKDKNEEDEFAEDIAHTFPTFDEVFSVCYRKKKKSIRWL